MKKVIGVVVVSCLLLVSMVGVAAKERNCSCNKGGEIVPMVIHGDEICCHYDPKSGEGYCTATRCIRYNSQWHCERYPYKNWPIYSNRCYPICGLYCYHCCWYA